MQLLGRLCEACGATVAKVGDGDGCGGCDVVVCGACLRGTDRCPSCQRPFDDTRDAPPQAEVQGDARLERGRLQVRAVAVTLGGAVLLLGALGASTGRGFIFQAIAIVLLLVQLFRGRGWARWLLVTVAGLFALTYCLYGFRTLGEGSSVLSAGLALAFGWSAGVLALSKPVARYLRAQRLRHP